MLRTLACLEGLLRCVHPSAQQPTRFPNRCTGSNLIPNHSNVLKLQKSRALQDYSHATRNTQHTSLHAPPLPPLPPRPCRRPRPCHLLLRGVNALRRWANSSRCSSRHAAPGNAALPRQQLVVGALESEHEREAANIEINGGFWLDMCR